MRIRYFSISLCFALLFFLTACDSGGSNDDDGDVTGDGEVTLNITGEGVNESLTGNAFFATGEDPETGESAFVVYLFSGDEFSTTGTYAILARSSSRPGTGSYGFVDVEDDNTEDLLRDQFAMVVSMGGQDGNQVGQTFFSTSGGLNITTSSENRVAGDFDLNGGGVIFDGNEAQEVNVSITGSFDAPGGQYIAPPTF